MDNINKYYEAQKKNRDNDSIDPVRIRHSQTWLQDNTVNYWRHKRMYDFVNPFMDCFPDASWLTVGDGTFASEARYIRKKVMDVTATDISGDLLRKAKELGYIEKFSIENAESLSFGDASFDFVLCKESYHHFPRPMIALYEMLRVARRAVILIEPLDPLIGMMMAMRDELAEGDIPYKDLIRTLLKKTHLLGALRKVKMIGPPSKGFYHESFEPSGNYVYGISKVEIAKVALGIGLPTLAFAALNDYYEYGVEFEKATEESQLFRKVRDRIKELDRGKTMNMLVAAIFKAPIDGNFRKKLKEGKYEIHDLPKNPHI